jgi:hypothetical protein
MSSHPDDPPVSPEMADRLQALVSEQDANRGDWGSPRTAEMPNPPWPAQDNPALEYLVNGALSWLDDGRDTREVVRWLAAHAWFEGGVEAYDRGRRDAASVEEPPSDAWPVDSFSAG